MRTPNNEFRGTVNDDDSDEEEENMNEEEVIEQNENDVAPGHVGLLRRKGKRVKRRPHCGTGGCL